MKEDFLHYIWRYQKFDSHRLNTTDGTVIQVVKPGFSHIHAGPDFQQARVLIDSIEWNGAVEIHIKSSDWNKHNHSSNPSYENVILHVVWEHDIPIEHQDGTIIPTLELKEIVDLGLMGKYEGLQRSEHEIPCAKHWFNVSAFQKSIMFEKTLVERLRQKSEKAKVQLEEGERDWDQTSYYLLLSALGSKINQHPFEHLAEVLPYGLLKKYRAQVFQLEALIFGVAGFLSSEFIDEYPRRLKTEWEFLRHKHRAILKSAMQLQEWKFLRLRPANFPTIRLAELAQIVHVFPSLFDAFVIDFVLAEVKHKLEVQVSDYWLSHYQFDKESKFRKKKMGENSIKTIIVNCIPTLLALYASTVGEEKYMDKALDLLSSLKAEQNYITKKFFSLGQSAKSAFDTQAMIQLHNEYCQPKKCLDCSIGLALLKE